MNKKIRIDASMDSTIYSQLLLKAGTEVELLKIIEKVISEGEFLSDVKVTISSQGELQ